MAANDVGQFIEKMVQEARERVAVEVEREAEQQVAEILRARGWIVEAPVIPEDHAEARRRRRQVAYRRVRLFGITDKGLSLYEVVE